MNPFDKYEKQSKILKGDLSALTSSHIPDSFPHRERQINLMVEALSSIMRNSRPSNLLLYGKTGTGKSSITQYVMSKLAEKAPDSILSCYLNCQTFDSPYSILINVAKSVSGNDNIPPSGWPLDRVYTELSSRIEKSKKYLVIILDEIDKLVEKNGGDSLYVILKAADESKGAKTSIIGITNDTSFTEKLDSRVKSRLNQESIVFPPYNASELKDILEPRVRGILAENSIEEPAINLCAAIGAQEHGDARKAIDLMRIAIELAIRDDKEIVTTEHVYRSRDKLETDVLKETIRTLPTHTKIVIMGCITASEMNKTGEIYANYKDICHEMKVPPVSSRRVSDLLSDLEDAGLITTTIRSLGRYGRTRYIQLNEKEKEMKKYLMEDEEVGNFEISTKSIQTRFGNYEANNTNLDKIITAAEENSETETL
ncbi:MAG: ORC1-type DNA replication protein [Thermoplasmataceae archaeon]